MPHSLRKRSSEQAESASSTDGLIVDAVNQGVLAFNPQQELIRCNSSAVKLLSLKGVPQLGSSLHHCISNPILRELILKAILLRQKFESALTITNQENLHVQAEVNILSDDSTFIGVVVVLTDTTRLKRLETLRRDFVANVSHELKTPITSIKGFVETLLDGANDKPEDARRFLEIIRKQADRLNNIFEDLLLLARIEQQEEQGQIDRHPTKVKTVIDSVVQTTEQLSRAKDISISVDCDPNLMLPTNAHLIEQAIVNLVDNAIKYSGGGATVQIVASSSLDEVCISVIDNGVGIDESHLPRIWERFYRVDQARSRKLGGTGLGLAIVKHIAQAHDGYVDVKSVLGKGCTFSIHLPRNPQL